jgi:hypothetical protein
MGVGNMGHPHNGEKWGHILQNSMSICHIASVQPLKGCTVVPVMS